uniref:BTB/POZ domain-containing protein KCTD9 n=1 Tax=Timema douglasi TaxID=61478 RepID=A0A7R8Z5C9_TIMDO|nr:unnamed protein product [Timema douglasi]
MKRVILFRNGTEVNGKVVLVTHSLEELLIAASSKFGIVAKRLFTPHGGEIDDLKLIRDDDILYVTESEDFIPIVNYSSLANNACGSSNCAPTVPIPAQYSEREQHTWRKKNSEWVTLNVGGKYFTTSRSTLLTKEPMSMLARMFAEGEGGYLMAPSNMDRNGAYLIDRSPTYFEPILNYLRNGQLIFDTNVNPEVPQLETIIQSVQRSRDIVPLARRDVINALILTPYTAELRFQGVNLAGSDLSRLDLRYINFKYACLHGCRMVGANLSWCCLERADLSHVVLEGAQLLGVKMLCANLEGANLRGCNFEDPAGSRANMEGVNLKGANLEGSNMAGVNLRVATLKNANLQNCDLRAAVLAGADLETTDGIGSVVGSKLLEFWAFGPCHLGNKPFLSSGANLDGRFCEKRNCFSYHPGQVGGTSPRCRSNQRVTGRGEELILTSLRIWSEPNHPTLLGVGVGALPRNCPGPQCPENCDLSGSDLHEANLRGANLKDAAFELMLTPLHMSQTIR